MFNTVKILILEDDLQTLFKLFQKLAELEDNYVKKGVKVDFATTVLSDYLQVEEYINVSSKVSFDVILLDNLPKYNYNIVGLKNALTQDLQKAVSEGKITTEEAQAITEKSIDTGISGQPEPQRTSGIIASKKIGK